MVNRRVETGLRERANMMVLRYKKWGLIVEKERYQFRGTTRKCEEVGVVHIHFHGIGVGTNTSDVTASELP